MKISFLRPAVLGPLLFLGALLGWKTAWHRADSLAATHSSPPPPSETITQVSCPSDSTHGSATRLALERQCLTLAEHDPLAAMEMALREKLCAEDPGLLTSLMLQWASRDFPAAYEWTKTQAAGPWRNDIFARLAYLQAKADPLAGARIVVTEIPPGPARDEATLSVLHQWVLHDSEAASVWAESIPEGPVHQRAVAEIAGLKKISATPGQ